MTIFSQWPQFLGYGGLLLVLSLSACQGLGLGRPHAAVAHMTPASDSGVKGLVTFAAINPQSPAHLRVDVQLSGLVAQHVYGLHVHANGDCSAPDAMSAGGYFNPSHPLYSGPQSSVSHADGLLNVTADAQGRIDQQVWIDTLTLSTGEMTDIQGRSVVLHADPDDHHSQPVGNSGHRIACGVIRIH
jgi:Cu-Zn family superoxide dismutase